MKRILAYSLAAIALTAMTSAAFAQAMTGADNQRRDRNTVQQWGSNAGRINWTDPNMVVPEQPTPTKKRK